MVQITGWMRHATLKNRIIWVRVHETPGKMNYVFVSKQDNPLYPWRVWARNSIVGNKEQLLGRVSSKKLAMKIATDYMKVRP